MFRFLDASQDSSATRSVLDRKVALNFEASADRLARLDEERGFVALAQSRKKGAAGAKEQAEGRMLQAAIRTMLGSLPT